MRAGQPRREEKPRGSIWLLFLHIFSPPPSLPYINWASQEGCVCFTWGSHSGPQTFLLSIFCFSILCLLATAILDSFFLFYLTHESLKQKKLTRQGNIFKKIPLDLITADEKAINVFVCTLFVRGWRGRFVVVVMYVRCYMQTPLNARESQISNTLTENSPVLLDCRNRQGDKAVFCMPY